MPKKYSKKPKSAPPKGSNAPKQPESLPLPTTELPKAAPHSPSTFTTPGPLPTRPSTSSSAPGPSSSALLSYVEITPPPGDNIVLVEALFSALPPTILTFFKMSTSELEGKISKPPALPAAQDATIGSLYPLAPIEFRNCTMTDNLVIPPGMTLELMVAGYAVKGSAGLDKAIAQYPRNTKLRELASGPRHDEMRSVLDKALLGKGKISVQTAQAAAGSQPPSDLEERLKSGEPPLESGAPEGDTDNPLSQLLEKLADDWTMKTIGGSAEGSSTPGAGRFSFEFRRAPGMAGDQEWETSVGKGKKKAKGKAKDISEYPSTPTPTPSPTPDDADPIATGLSVMHREASRGLQRVNEGEGPSTLTHEQVKARAVTIAGVSGYQAYMQHASSKGIDGSGLLPFMEFLGKYVAAVAAGDVPFHNPS